MIISNNMIAVVLIIAILISVSQIMVILNKLQPVKELTGYQAQQVPGIANFSIRGIYEIRMISNITDFGVLSPASLQAGDYIMFVTNDSDCPEEIQGEWKVEKGCNSGGGTVTIPDGAVDSQTWEGYPDGLRYAADMVIENSGNTPIAVEVSGDAPASTWIGGTNPKFKVSGKNNEEEPGACTGLHEEWGDVSDITHVRICDSLDWDDSGDMMNVSFMIRIPQDVPAENKEVELTFYAVEP